ncbi:membrane protein insertion efficiency factor YidD [Sulfitobacter guttiformis]|uniref:membrane protein insertion efficiency factor YidD n=1 Tax=Sulfitobacter guttiformis TaxID=74349 RepID=UPI000687B27F|nr:membrane protein insertion efficiency factor YidD [Sulfitobacter guttiformis]KIN73633.1 hypothetical protein Z949_2825 [Sulfitobacter guttiformis KCTC 32187]
MLSQPALTAIGAYQRYLSPRKGYGCAYRLANDSAGCSGFANQAITDFGILSSVPPILKRFADCEQAAMALQNRSEDEGPSNNKKKSRWHDHGDYCGSCYCQRAKSFSAETSPDCSPDCRPDCCSL